MFLNVFLSIFGVVNRYKRNISYCSLIVQYFEHIVFIVAKNRWSLFSYNDYSSDSFFLFCHKNIGEIKRWLTKICASVILHDSRSVRSWIFLLKSNLKIQDWGRAMASVPFAIISQKNYSFLIKTVEIVI